MASAYESSRYSYGRPSAALRSRYDSLYDASPSSPVLTSYSTTYSSYARLPTSYTPSSTSRGTTGSSAGSGGSSNYIKYQNYLDDLSLRGRSSMTRELRPLASSSSVYQPRHLMISDLAGSDLGPASASASTSYVGADKYKAGKIKSSPLYDKFGRELENYERWKLSKGEDLVPSSSSSSESPLPPSRTLSRYPSSRYEDDADGNASKKSQLQGRREATVAPLSSASATVTEVADFPQINSSSNSGNNYGNSSGRFRSSSSSFKPLSSSSSSSSPSYRSSSLHSFPSGVKEKLAGYDVKDVRGDGGCYYRCLSLFFTGSEEHYMKYRREVVAYIRDNLDNYSTMIRSEMGRSSSTSDYFSRKTRADRQDWAETTEIIATCCVYNLNVHVLAVVPSAGGRRQWEWLHFDPSIGTGKPCGHAARDVYLYNQGSVHFMLCTPR